MRRKAQAPQGLWHSLSHPGSLGIQGAIDLTKEMLTDEKYLHLIKFSTRQSRVHYSTTGPEIYRQLKARLMPLWRSRDRRHPDGGRRILKSRIAKLKI